MSSEYKIPFGRKFKGKMFKDIPVEEMQRYIKWLETSVRPGASLDWQVQELKNRFTEYLESQFGKDHMIEVDTYRGKEMMTVDHFVVHRLMDDGYGSGQLETCASTVRNILDSYARLLECLADKGILNIDELRKVVG